MLEDFTKTRVLVIGDVMLDRYWWGTVSRISPEAPVPVVALNKTSLVAGGAANVAANVAGLGAKPYLVGVVGDDDEASLFSDVLAGAGVSGFRLFPIKDRKTTVKTRIVAHNQQIVRLDQETTDEISAVDAETILTEIRPLFAEIDIVVISDYAKGFLNPKFVQDVIAFAKDHNKPILVDPKGRDYTKYRGATILTPNRREAADACSLEYDSPNLVEVSGKLLLRDLSLDALLITLGEEGMTLLESNRESEYLQATARNVYDVTGAGDTVIATMAVALGSGMDFLQAARIANTAAGVVVEKVGTTSISRTELERALSEV